MAVATKNTAKRADGEFHRTYSKADNLMLPTALEIAEGTAYLAYIADLGDREAHRIHAEAFNALSRAQNRAFTCWRCRECAVFATGRMRGQKCGHCGAVLVALVVPTC